LRIDQDTATRPEDTAHPLGHAMTPVLPGGTYAHAIENDIGNWNLLHSDGNAVETGIVVQNLAPSTFIPCPDLTHRWNQDLLAAKPEVVADDPYVIVYRISQGAMWNDGTPLTADDFIYTYRLQNGIDAPSCNVSTHAGYELIESVAGSPDGKTVTVTFRRGKFFPDWESMFCYIQPAHIAARSGDLGTDEGMEAAFDSFNDQPPAWSAGPYQIERYAPGDRVVLVPNPRWYGRVKPVLDRVEFVVIHDRTDLVPSLRERRINGMNPQPSAEILAAVAALPGVRSEVSLGWAWDHVDLNMRTPALDDVALRCALFTATDRAELIRCTVAAVLPGIQPLGSHCFVPGLPGYRDVVGRARQGQGDLGLARSILTAAGYLSHGDRLHTPADEPVPELVIRFSEGNAMRERVAGLLVRQWAELGVLAKPVPTANLGKTLGSGEYDAIIFGWGGNPARIGPARDMFGSDGGMNFGHFANPEVDRLIQLAAGTSDLPQAHELLNQADEVLTKHAYTLPLYQRPTLLAVDERFGNIENNVSNGLIIYNIEHWGLRRDIPHGASDR
jgi:peptide/nickel transport system substrate-binding protein